ncbi:MAG TPA: TIGR02757 family protein [Myxococcaceae bacterium]|nr:TIGR02757 family protein [Myxococcaceae bacterium]
MATRKRTSRRTLGPTGLARLSAPLNALADAAASGVRVGFDPVAIPRRYTDPRDIEVSGLIAAGLAYGRVSLFVPRIEEVLAGLGPRPAAGIEALTLPRAKALLEGFVYRFNVGTDVAVLLFGMQAALRRHGSLEQLFLSHRGDGGDLHATLSGFLAELRDIPMAPLRHALGHERGLQHLLPSPLGAGASKRLLMYLRWMVRGPDAVDLGIWKRVPAAELLLPLDTHTGRLAQHLGLTARSSLNWAAAEEVTAALRTIDPEDPVRFDFALCHHGMSGGCPPTPRPDTCEACVLLPACRTGARLMGRRSRTPSRPQRGS